MAEVYVLAELLMTAESRKDKSTRRYLRYAIASVLAEQQLRDLKRVNAWMRRQMKGTREKNDVRHT